MSGQSHKFSEAGLGLAPFRFAGVTENAFRLPDGNTKPGGSCDYCGNGIRWEYHIISDDGTHSKVGSDCIQKAGDRGLFDVARTAANKLSRDRNHAKREARRELALQKQRDANGGLTDWEVQELKAAQRKEAIAAKRAPIIASLAEFADILEDGNGRFRDDIAEAFRRGELVSTNAARIAAEIVAKEVGRKNSNAYKKRFAEVAPIINRALDSLEEIQNGQH
jgi:hypothetical protein